MNDQLVNEALTRLDALCAKLGVGAEHLWGVLVKQQMVDAVVVTVLWPIPVILALVALRYVRKITSKTTEGYDVVSIISLVVFSVIALFTLAPCAFTAANGFLNPEYGAAREIMELLR